MQLSQETIQNLLKELIGNSIGNDQHSYEVGRSYLVRATYHHIGRLVAVTATDLVLTVTQMLREYGVVGRFVEFFGPGLDCLDLPDRDILSGRRGFVKERAVSGQLSAAPHYGQGLAVRAPRPS